MHVLDDMIDTPATSRIPRNAAVTRVTQKHSSVQQFSSFPRSSTRWMVSPRTEDCWCFHHSRLWVVPPVIELQPKGLDPSSLPSSPTRNAGCRSCFGPSHRPVSLATGKRSVRARRTSLVSISCVIATVSIETDAFQPHSATFPPLLKCSFGFDFLSLPRHVRYRDSSVRCAFTIACGSPKPLHRHRDAQDLAGSRHPQAHAAIAAPGYDGAGQKRRDQDH